MTTRSEKFIILALCILILVLTGGIAYRIRQQWFRPLGPVLASTFEDSNLSTPASTGSTPIQTVVNSISEEPEISSAPTTFEIPTSEPLPGLCGGTSPMFILLIGSDTRAEGYSYGLADVIRILRIDFNRPEIRVLEFPRDLWVVIPDIADNLNGESKQKLNQAYLYGNKGFGYTDDPSGGPGLLARTLSLNFGTRIDQYVAVNMYTFEKIINSVDGIDVTLPKTVDGRTENDNGDHLLFIEGTHHLNGEQALTLARIRINGVFDRADNQNRVLCGLRDKLSNPAIIADLPKLIQSFQGAVQTSLSPEQISQLSCLGTNIVPRNIILTSFPQELFVQSRVYDSVSKKDTFVWDVDFNLLRDYTKKFNMGLWPSPAVAISANQLPPPSIVKQAKPEALFCE